MKLKKDFKKLTRKERIVIYDKLVKKYGETCMICGAERKSNRLSIDHCHKSKVLVRGLLCIWCNKGLAWFKDDPQKLRSAARYLRRTR